MLGVEGIPIRGLETFVCTLLIVTNIHRQPHKNLNSEQNYNLNVVEHDRFNKLSGASSHQLLKANFQSCYNYHNELIVFGTIFFFTLFLLDHCIFPHFFQFPFFSQAIGNGDVRSSVLHHYGADLNI